MTINHLVISGGGPTGIIAYGVLQKLHMAKLWELKNIETVYAASIGCLISIFIVLGYSWDIIDEYIIDRPWEKALAGINQDILTIFHNKGMDGTQFFKIITGPLLKGKNLSDEITLKELYDFTGIKLYFMAAEINQGHVLQNEVISHDTYPDMTLNTAIACSCAVPVLFKPVVVGNKCFIDGGVINNYPLSLCITNNECDPDDVLAILCNSGDSPLPIVDESSTFLEFIHVLLQRNLNLMSTTKAQPVVKYSVTYLAEDMADASLILSILYEKDARRALINRGHESAEALLKVTCQETV